MNVNDSKPGGEFTTVAAEFYNTANEQIMWGRNVHIVAAFQKARLIDIKDKMKNHHFLTTFLQPILPSQEWILRDHERHKNFVDAFDPRKESKNKEEGISWVSSFKDQGSIVFAWSFTLDAMHMAYESTVFDVLLKKLLYVT